MTSFKMFKCQICDKLLKTKSALGHHLWFKHSIEGKNWILIYRTNSKSRQDFTFNCLKCKKEFVFTTTKYQIEIGNYPKHCSKSCAGNGRVDSTGIITKVIKCIDCFCDITVNKRSGKSRCEKCKESRSIKFRKCKICGSETVSKFKAICHGCKVQYYEYYLPSCRFNFQLKDYGNLIDLSLIEDIGMYGPPNRGNNVFGVSRDHMFSVKQGFDLKIDPLIIGHPANCRLLPHKDNQSKRHRSIITLDELIERISLFEISIPSNNRKEILSILDQYQN